MLLPLVDLEAAGQEDIESPQRALLRYVPVLTDPPTPVYAGPILRIGFSIRVCNLERFATAGPGDSFLGRGHVRSELGSGSS